MKESRFSGVTLEARGPILLRAVPGSPALMENRDGLTQF